MHILFVTAKLAPFAAEEELSTFAGQLPVELDRLGDTATVVAPFPGDLDGAKYGLARRISKLEVTASSGAEPVAIVEGTLSPSQARVVMFEAAALTPLTTDPEHAGAAELLAQCVWAWVKASDATPDIVHCIGTPTIQTGLLLAKSNPDAALIFTCADPADVGEELGGADLWRQFSHRTTFAPASAKRHHLDERPWVGLLGGIDRAWDPETDHRISKTYNAHSLEDRAENRHQVLEKLQLSSDLRETIAIAPGPWTSTGALSTLVDTHEQWADWPMHLVFVGDLGSGAADVEKLRAQAPHRIHHLLGGTLSAQQLFAGSDILIDTSDANGGTQLMQALRYGLVPVAPHSAAARDIVVDFDAHSGTGTGFCFAPDSEEAWIDALARALASHADARAWRAVQRNALRQTFSWTSTAQGYRRLYEQTLPAGSAG